MIDLLKIGLYPEGVHATILVRSFQVDHFFEKVGPFSWTTGSVLLDTWLYEAGIYS
jgi:hypothetical protein